MLETGLAATAAATEPRRVPLPGSFPGQLQQVGLGTGLCGAVTLVALALEAGERRMFGRPWLEALVLAILIGTAVRSLWEPGQRWRPGVAFSAKTLLEVAIMLLGASISFRNLESVGPELLLGIVAVVAVAIPTSFSICRALGLPLRMSILVACGNSICGNSAIAAVAPVIGADCKDVATSIAFTAALGVLVVLGLPLLVPALMLSQSQFGTLTGLTVYAVPQVLAAAAPVGIVAVQVGTLVKLVRVLMLGPVVLALSLLAGRLGEGAAEAAPPAAIGTELPAGRVPLYRMVPWFIVGFLALATARSLDLIPAEALPPMAGLASILTILSMAALGLGVDVRVVAKAGLAVITAVTASLLALLGISLWLIRLLGVA